MNRKNRVIFALFLLFLSGFCPEAGAQQDTAAYRGYRIGLFNFQIKSSKPPLLSLLCDAANTGRTLIDYRPPKVKAPASLIIEFDSVALPPVLRGREALIAEAVRQQAVHLKPGETKSAVPLEINIKTAVPASTRPPNALAQCPDLVIDTAYIVAYSKKSMSVQYILRNRGTAPAYLLGPTDSKKDNLALNVYFVSGVKMTRGAILAGQSWIEEGKETLDGILQPGLTMQGELQVSLKNRTRFSPNLVLELDPFLTVEDCDRTNNTKVVVVGF